MKLAAREPEVLKECSVHHAVCWRRKDYANHAFKNYLQALGVLCPFVVRNSRCATEASDHGLVTFTLGLLVIRSYLKRRIW